jgi:signal transduction histidine kinase
MDLVVSLPERSDIVQAGGSSHRLALTVAVVSILTAGASVLSLWPFWSSNPVLGVINLLVAVSLVVTGIVLGEVSYHRTTARMIVGAAVFWLMSWWWAWPPEWQVGPLALLSNVFGYMWFVFGALALLRYPNAVLSTRFERVYCAAMAAWVCLGKIVIALVSEPEWDGYSLWSWWPTVAPDRGRHDALTSVFYVGMVTFAVLVLFLLLQKLRRSRGMDRLDSLPVIVAASTVALSGAIYISARLFDFSSQVIDVLRVTIGVSALVTPLAFLMTVLRRRLARSVVADLVVRIAGAPTVAHVQQELRCALQDPSLTLWAWLPEESLYANVDGARHSGPHDGDGWSVPIRTSGGAHLAMLVLDQSLRRHPALVESAVVAVGLALEVQAQLAEVSASRMRIAAAAVDERRRLERDLHDGVQQSLLAASASLGAARVKAPESSEVMAAIEQARDDLRTASAELRQLARGIHPAVLSQSGLLPAIEDVAERLPLNVDLRIPAQRWNAEVETTVYFLACEAFTNAVRHSGARRVSLSVDAGDAAVNVEIRDDGRGGAVPSKGSGLAGMRDRVHALGGTLTIHSPAGGGTFIRAVVPCE